MTEHGDNIRIHPPLNPVQLQRCGQFDMALLQTHRWVERFPPETTVKIGRVMPDRKLEESVDVNSTQFVRGMRRIVYSLYMSLKADPATADVVEDIIEQHRHSH